MKNEKIIVIADIAQLMIDLQMEHSLPVNIIVGDSEKDCHGDEQQVILCEYEEVDYNAYAWLMSRAVYNYTNMRLNKASEETRYEDN